MKKSIALTLVLICVLGLMGCANQTPKRIETIEGNLKTYYKEDGISEEAKEQIKNIIVRDRRQKKNATTR